jgi:hypothetical protein
MAVGTNENVKYQAAGNGSNTTFATLLVAAGPSEIGVWITTAAGAVTAQVAGVDYTFSNLGGTATIVFQTAPPAGSTVTFLRKTAIAQALDLTYNERLPSIQIEAQLDALVRMIRDLDARATIAFPGAEPAGNPTTLSAPAQRKGKLLAFNNNTGAMEELSKAELLSEVLGDAQADLEAAVSAAGNSASAASASAGSASASAGAASASASAASASAGAASASAGAASNSASAASASASAAAASAVLADVTNTSVNAAIATDPAATQEVLHIPPRRTKINGGLFTPLRLALDSSRGIDVCVVGDSLGNAPDEYAESFVSYLAGLYPGHRVVKRLITENASASLREWTQTILQAASGEFYWNFPASNTTVIGPTFSRLDCPIPTGDFDVEIKIRLNDWEGNHGFALFEAWGVASPRLTRVFQLKIVNSRRLQLLFYNGSGNLQTLTSANLGTVAGAVTSTAPADGTDWTLRARFDVDNGAGGSSVTFSKSADDGATWTDMTTLTQASTTGLWEVDSRDVGTAVFRIGGEPTVAIRDARIYQMLLRHGHGTKTVNRRAIDYANSGSTNNLITTGGSPTIYLHNYSYPGRNTRDLRSDLLGIKPMATVVATGTVTGSGDATVTVTAAGLSGSPLSLNVAVAAGDTAAVWAGKVRQALIANASITDLFAVTGFGSSIQLEHINPQTNDATLVVALATGTATGITSTTSTITITGNPRHVDRLFADFGVGVLFFHGGINDQWAGDFTGGSRRWVQGVEEIVDAVLSRNADLIPILVATNPKSPASGLNQLGNDQQSLRSALMANLARRRNWAFVDVWTSFKEDGRALNTLIPDGTHPSSQAIAELWTPLILNAFDNESNP